MPKDSVEANVSSLDDIQAPFLSRFVFTIATACMGACAVAGVLLLGLGGLYVTSVENASFGPLFIGVGSCLLLIGAAGALASWKRNMALMMVAEVALIVAFIALYIVTIIAFMMATGSTSPVEAAVDKAWEEGMRSDLLENDADRWCEKNTLIVGPCYGFYEDAAAASRRRVGYGAAGCNLTVTEMALDCQAGLDGCRVSRESCQACDQDCKSEFKKDIKKLLDPAVYVTFVLFGVAFVNIFIINVMLGQPVRSMTLVKVGYVLNCLIGFISTMCCVIFGVVVSKMSQECPADQSCVSVTILGAFSVIVGMLGISIVTLFGLWRDNMWVLRLSAILYIVFGFFLLMVAILLAMASGAISDLGTYYDENWVSIRAELDQSGYCDDVDVDATGNVVRPFNPDPHNDPCKTKMEEETADAAVSVAGFGIFVMLFMIATIYFNLRAIKEMGTLGEYREGKMGEITENRAAMMQKQAEQLAEKKLLEKKIKLETAKLEAKLADLEGGGKNKNTIENPMNALE